MNGQPNIVNICHFSSKLHKNSLQFQIKSHKDFFRNINLFQMCIKEYRFINR